MSQRSDKKAGKSNRLSKHISLENMVALLIVILLCALLLEGKSNQKPTTEEMNPAKGSAQMAKGIKG